MKRNWSMREYREGDEEKIFGLWKIIFSSTEIDRQLWMKRWHWKYKENPAGPSKISLAELDGTIIGHYAIVPFKMKVGDSIIKGGQTVTAATHPNYRRIKIFETLAKRLTKKAEKDNIFIIFSFPNKLARLALLKRLNRFKVSKRKVFVKPLRWNNILKLKFRNKFLFHINKLAIGLIDKISVMRTKKPKVDGLTIKRVSSFDERINDLWNKVFDQHKIIVVRDVDYLNWRYVSVPGANYQIYIAEKKGEIHGYLVFKFVERAKLRECRISEVLAISRKITQCLVSEVIEECQRQKIDIASCEMLANKEYRTAFKTNGFIYRPNKGRWICAYSNWPNVTKKFLKNPKNWFVMPGDSDMN